MPTFGKPTATGRSGGKRNGREGRILGPPKDEPWVWLTRELLCSDAWRLRSRQCTILIDTLCIDHLNNAGQENGHLVATYDQLEAKGCRRASLRQAIREACYLGLIKVTKHGGRWAMTNRPSRYRLTFLPFFENGIASDPTNEWRRRSAQQIRRWRRQQKARTKANALGKQHAGCAGATTVGALTLLPGGKSKSSKNKPI